MFSSEEDAIEAAVDLWEDHVQQVSGKDQHIGKVRRYLAGDQDLPLSPEGASRQFRLMAETSLTNVLPLIVDSFAKNLQVDGYRAARETDNAPGWAYWQSNGLDARQKIAHKTAIAYGTSYVLVLPAEPTPLIRPLRVENASALYREIDDDFPEYGIVHTGLKVKVGNKVRKVVDLYDERKRYRVILSSGDTSTTASLMGPPEDHGLDVCPLVRFRASLDDESLGIVNPLIHYQDRLNGIVFNLVTALHYAAFRQRWATGLEIPKDPDTGEKIEPFKASVSRVWTSDSPDTRFGDFSQTDVSGHLRAIEQTMKAMATSAQLPPLVFAQEFVNISTESFGILTDPTIRKIQEYETLFGESWEQVFRLAGRADGNPSITTDLSSQVRWRDTEARSLAATIDALVKMVAGLGVPKEATWEKIPGITDQDVDRWKALASESGIDALLGEIAKQAAPSLPALE